VVFGKKEIKKGSERARGGGCGGRACIAAMYYLICDLMQLHVLYICTKLICITLIFMYYLNPNVFLAHRCDPRTMKRSDTPKPLLNPKP
jgi:hypothetical protein